MPTHDQLQARMSPEFPRKPAAPDLERSPGGIKPPRQLALPGLLYLLTLIFFLNSLSRVVLAPLLPAIELELGVSHAEAGSLFLFISLGYSSMLLASGFVAARLTHHWTIVASLSALGLALIGLLFSRSLATVQLSLLLLGLSAGLYLPSGLAKITTLLPSERWGRAMAIHELAPNLSSLAAPLLAGVLYAVIGWRGIVVGLGFVCTATAVLFAVCDRGPQIRGRPPELSVYRSILSSRAIWLMIGLFSLGIGSNLGVFSMLSLFLVAERGYPQEWAGTLLMLSRLSTPICVIFAGWAADRFGLKRLMGSALVLTGVVTCLLGFAQGHWLVLLLFIQPVFSVAFFPAAFALLSRLASPTTRNLTVSMTIPLAVVVGTGVMPSLIGMAGDVGSLGLGLSIWGIAIASGVVLLRYV